MSDILYVPKNKRFKEIETMLLYYRFNDHELDFLEKEIKEMLQSEE